MRITTIVWLILVFGLLFSCHPFEKEVNRENLSGTWEFLGFWENDALQPDTIKVYFSEDDTILLATTGYDVITDSGVRKIIKEGEKVITSEPNPYYATIVFENTTVGSIQNYDSTGIFNPPLKVQLSHGQADVFGEAIIDETRMDTLIQESAGTIGFIDRDIIQVQWDYGGASRFKKVDDIPRMYE